MSMSEQELGIALSDIKQFVDKYVVRIGVTIGIIFLIYFFTFAMLIDKAPLIYIMIQVITSILFVFALFKIKEISFYLAKLKLAKKSPYSDIFSRLTVADLEKSESDLMRIMKQQITVDG